MKVRIKSLDIHDGNYIKTFEIVKIVKDNNKREYHYKDEFGICKILKRENQIEIYRFGQINSKQIFILNKKTVFTYITDSFKGKYEIFTKKLLFNDGKIMMEYDIINGNEIINSIELEIVFLKKLKLKI